jgi:hypothetical protein
VAVDAGACRRVDVDADRGTSSGVRLSTFR